MGTFKFEDQCLISLFKVIPAKYDHDRISKPVTYWDICILYTTVAVRYFSEGDICPVTAKKVIENKVPNFGIKKVLWKKFSTWKVFGNKSYHFETLFSSTCFLVPVWLYTKTSPEKSPIIVENAWEQRMFTTMQNKEQLILFIFALKN